MAPSISTTPRSHNDYTVGWVCALTKEQTAAKAMLDETHPSLAKPSNDSNAYILGSIGNHNVVIACLPMGQYGTNSAATVATQMIRTFQSIKIGLLVGIGGGVSPKVRLGDVVVSVPSGAFPGVVQWDMGKTQDGAFERTGSLDNPPSFLLTTLTTLATKHEMEGSSIPEYLNDLKTKWPRLAAKYLRSSSLEDVLFEANYPHSKKRALEHELEGVNDSMNRSNNEGGGKNCKFCDKTKIVKREDREISIHYGLIASGNQLVKDAKFRDYLNQESGGNLLCVEMEAAGLVNFPCLVVRGICDYADSHKNDDWQEHAAAVAAAFTKELLGQVQPSDVEEEKTLKEIVDRTLNSIAVIEDYVLQTNSRINRAEDDKILNWITPIDYGPQQTDLIRRREPATCQWLPESEQYRAWLQTRQQTILYYGIPGAGKTILTSVAVNQLYGQYRNDTHIGIAYVYCNFQRQDEQTVERLLESLLKQLCQRLNPLPRVVKELHDAHHRERTRPSLDKLLETLQSVARQFERSFILIDALDELDSRNYCQKQVLSSLFQLQSSCGTNIFATSREIREITNHFNMAMRIRVSATSDDVTEYLNRQMNKSNLTDETLRQYIVDEIISAIDGMFLLAVLHFSMISQLPTKGHIKEALRSLPKGAAGLDTTYERTMQRIVNQGAGKAKLAKQALGYIVSARRPLGVQELQHALAIRENTNALDQDFIPDLELLQSICAGLITVEKESKIIHLVHYTTQEYFEREKQRWCPTAEADLAQACLTYLLFDAFKPETNRDVDHINEIISMRLESHPFYRYSAQFWAVHARVAPFEEDDLVLRFLRCEARIAEIQLVTRRFYSYGWFTEIMIEGMMSTPYRSDVENMPALHSAAHFGLAKATTRLLDTGWDLNLRDDHGITPLARAAAEGHKETVAVLLKRGADTELLASSTNGTPLHFAVNGTHRDIVELLLANGANIESKNANGLTPLMYATRIEDRENITQLLLEKGADIESRDQMNCTPLFFAISHYKKAAVKILLEEGANIEAEDTWGDTPLLTAISHNDLEGVKMLLDGGANVETVNAHGVTPLMQAAVGGSKAIGRLLLGKGANILPKIVSLQAVREYDSLTARMAYGAFMMQSELAEKGGKVVYPEAVREWCAIYANTHDQGTGSIDWNVLPPDVSQGMGSIDWDVWPPDASQGPGSMDWSALPPDTNLHLPYTHSEPSMGQPNCPPM
ncbi:Ankyrin repeat domain-containing protein 17 [Cladobotryum mycophilum]|uniref:Ankyrin repeat domain-containing protein 17 n=1 Tax=Cladobotryum mycophilum TaxID=491253 RepID=A0ABR0SHW3_9HYPO